MKQYTKRERQKILGEILDRQNPGAQNRLLRELEAKGVRVTQATVSRDLQEMGYVRVRLKPGFFRYEKMDAPGGGQVLERLGVLFANFVTDIKATGNLLLVKTSPGNANGVASLIDGLERTEILGTVAGDDTILVVVDSEKNREQVESEFRSLL